MYNCMIALTRLRPSLIHRIDHFRVFQESVLVPTSIVFFDDQILGFLEAPSPSQRTRLLEMPLKLITLQFDCHGYVDKSLHFKMRCLQTCLNVSKPRYNLFVGSTSPINRWMIVCLSRNCRIGLKNMSSPTVFVCFWSDSSHSKEKWKMKRLRNSFNFFALEPKYDFLMHYFMTLFDIGCCFRNISTHKQKF